MPKKKLTTIISLQISQLLDSYTVTEVCKTLKISAASIYQWRHQESMISKRKYIAIQNSLKEWQEEKSTKQEVT